jgi:DMSO/TMAO reductase YedYZ molybdopterin-dependent catalytic subunit
VDIHCVTKWSKLDTQWRGVPMDTQLDTVEHDRDYILAFCDGGYTTNLPIADVTGGQAWVAYEYDGGPLDPEHGGPARLLVYQAIWTLTCAGGTVADRSRSAAHRLPASRPACAGKSRSRR